MIQVFRMAVLATAFLAVVAAYVVADVAEPIPVGYYTVTLKQGDNTYPLPEMVGGNPHRIKEYLPQLVGGDRVFVESPQQEQVWATIDDSLGENHAWAGASGVVDDWVMPSFGGTQMLKVIRERDVETAVPAAGAFNPDLPPRFPDYSTEIPLAKMKLKPSTVMGLQTTITNEASETSATVTSKPFEIVLKGGKRIKAKIDSKARVIVDSETSKPIDIDVRAIDRLAVIEDPGATDKKVERYQLDKVARDIKQEADAFDRVAIFRTALVGTVWDSEHWVQCGALWLLALGLLSLLNKAFDLVWTWLGHLGQRAWGRLHRNREVSANRISSGLLAQQAKGSRQDNRRTRSGKRQANTNRGKRR